MALIGYARVSSVGQSLEVQETALREAGCNGDQNRIFAEKKSGRKVVTKENFLALTQSAKKAVRLKKKE